MVRWLRRGATAKNINSPELVEIYLLRHGQTVQSGTYTGISEVTLSEAGRQQIRSLIPVIGQLELNHCFCSTLYRCRESYELLGIEVPCTFDEDLREINFGNWEGLSFDQIQRTYGDQLNDWIMQGDNFTFPGGERISSFNERVTGWFDNLLTRDFDRVLIVAHGGVLRIGLCHLLDVKESSTFSFNFKEGALSQVEADDGFVHLEFFNYTGKFQWEG